MPCLPTVASRETGVSHSQTFQSHVRGDNLHLRSPEAWTSATITSHLSWTLLSDPSLDSGQHDPSDPHFHIFNLCSLNEASILAETGSSYAPDGSPSLSCAGTSGKAS